MTAVHHVDLTAEGFDFRLRVYPAPDPTGSMLVWLHGGAFMFGTLDMPEADQVGRRLSAIGTTVVSVEYTLAPVIEESPSLPEGGADTPPAPEGMPTPEEMRALVEAAGPRATFPVASLQTVAAFDWAVDNARQFGASPERVAMGGGSAGGTLAASAAVRLRDRATSRPGSAVPSALALVYPALHAVLPQADAELEALVTGVPEALAFRPESTRAVNRNYLGDASPDDPYAFPGGHDMRGLCPTLIVTADRDRLRSSAQAFAAELALAGVDVSLERQPGVLHGFLNEIGEPASERTLQLLENALRR